MSLHKHGSFWVFILFHIHAFVSSDGVNLTAPDPATESPSLSSAVFKPGPDSLFSLNLLSSFPEDLEISDYCSELLHIFGQRYVAYVNCLVPAARPVKVCQSCFSSYGSLTEIFSNISSDQMGPGNVSCRDSLLRSDRLMVVYVLYENLHDLWEKSDCNNCISKGFQNLTSDTLYFMNTLNLTLTCFEQYQQKNKSELCANCKADYRNLNVLYSGMEKNKTMCIDIEDAMNMTRRLWSKNFNCSFPREETVPVIAVSSFMLFLPIIFYLSSFLHSEQKKRKLIHPSVCWAESHEKVPEKWTGGRHVNERTGGKAAAPLRDSLIVPQRIIDLQRDLTALVTNIQTAADAKESMRRKELEETRRLRLEWLENDAKSTKEKFEEISKGWSIANQKVIAQELQEALNNQQKLCAALVEDKKKLINDLQQELKVADDRYVKDLRKLAEEVDLMIERMEGQISTLTKAYREELVQMKRAYQQETELMFTKDMTKWEQSRKELLDKEMENRMEWKKKVEEYEEKIHSLMLETANKCSSIDIELNAQFRDAERKGQQTKATNLITRLRRSKTDHEAQLYKMKVKQMLSRSSSLIKRLKKQMEMISIQDAELKKKRQELTEEYKQNIQQFERLKKKTKYIVAADARKFEEMWLMTEAELKQLVEKALLIDSVICKEHFGFAWERPHMPFMEISGPIQPQKHQAASQSFQTGQALQRSQGTVDASVGPDPKSTDVDKDGTEVQSESSAEVEEGKLSMETLKKVKELLCDESGFLMEDKLWKLLAPLEKEEQTFVKLCSLLCSLGFERDDMPRLAHFLINYKHQQDEVRRSAVDDCNRIITVLASSISSLSVCRTVSVESGDFSDKAEEEETNDSPHQTSELIDPNHVLPALKSFIEQLTRSRKSSGLQRASFRHVEVRDSSKDEEYWESMSNVISEDRIKLWDSTEDSMKDYLEVLTEIAALVPETQSLEQQNAELRMLLQQSLTSSREEEQSQEEQQQHGSQQHRAVQLVVPPGQDTRRPQRAQQPRHAGTGATAHRDSEVKQRSGGGGGGGVG
ncbi:Dynein regulatory complex protein 1 [Nibea albiflora]|uniref:Dynein regulatory complex protein 1 n=1 Tax=Nibea albiflora TaxID=240163 RepID=A0ACB7FE72_NIBAL|nr:Dynein regulatory complex protein 1 [Nibea albiflora]